MPANNSQLKELQKELSKQCSPYSYTRVNAYENFKTLTEFWEEVKKFAEENGMVVEDVNDPRIFSNDQRITFNGVDAIIAQFAREKEDENGYVRTRGPDKIWFHLNGARYRFYEKGAWALTLTNIDDFKAVHTCDYESLKNVYGEAVITLPFNQQRIMPGKRDDAVSTLNAYPDVASTTYRDWLMGQLLPLVKESLLTIQKFIFLCKKIIREREIQEAGKDYAVD